MSEVNQHLESLNKAFDEFKKTNDERIAEIEKKGSADPLLEAKLDAINAEIDKAQDRLTQVETANARKSVALPESGDLEQKSATFSNMMSKIKGTPLEVSGDEMQAYKKHFNQMLRKGDLYANQPENMKALSVGSDPEGGYLVEPDTSGRIVQKVFETSPMRQVASVQTIGTDALEGIYDLNEAGAGWVSETGTRSETTTPDLGAWRIPVHEIYAEPRATQKLLDDAMVDVEAWLGAKVADKFARTENAAFVTGDGVGKPRGFLTYSNGTTLPGTIEQFKTGVNGGFATDGTGGDVFYNIVYGLKAAYRSGARFFMGRSTQKDVRKIKDSNGMYIWQPGLAAGQPATLVGFPVLEFEDMPVPATGSLSIAFGNMGEAYQIVDRAGIRVLRDPYTAKPYVKFYTTKRVGGDVVNFEALKLMDFSA